MTNHDIAAPRDMPPPPDGGWGWVVVFASFMIHIVTDGVTYSFGLFLIEFKDYFNTGAGPTAWISSILVGVTLGSGPVASAFVNKYGCRPVTIVGAILGAASLFASTFATNVYTLYLTIGLGTGLGFGLIYLPAIVSVTCYFEKYRSLATGIAVCGSGLGTFVFAPLSEFLIRTLGWQGALWVLGALVLSCVVFGVLFRPLQPSAQTLSLEEMEPQQEKNTKENTQTTVLITSVEQKRPHSVHTYVPQKHMNGAMAHLSVQAEEDAVKCSFSQPMLMSQTMADGGSRVRQHSESSSIRSAQSGVMYRKDVLYRGSLYHIPLEVRKASLAEENTQVKNYAAQERPDGKVTLCGCFPVHPETRDTFTEMLDISLLTDPVFLLFVVSNFLTSIGFYIPYSFIAAMAEAKNLSKESSSFLLSVVGISNTISRIVLGYLTDKTWVNRLWVYNFCLTICGIATALSAFCYDFFTFFIYSAVFGFTVGAYVGLTSVILVDLLGLSKLTNAFGLLLLFQGIASFLGPPIAGLLYDATLSYNPGFYVAGVVILLSGVILFIVPMMQRRAERHKSAS